MKKLNTKSFWETRLSHAVNLQTVGNRAFSLDYNQWLYKAQKDSLGMLLTRNNITIQDRYVLDVGCGSGFFINFFDKKGAKHITGLDIADKSIEFLRKQFPHCDFLVNDISSIPSNWSESFDFISAISVLFHIVEDSDFSSALSNICNLVRPQGYIILSDSFKRPIAPTAKHVRLRDLRDYLTVFEKYNVEIIDIIPVYYLLNQTFIPFIIPPIVNLLGLGRYFYEIDNILRKNGFSNGRGGKFLLAKKRA